MFFKKFDLLSYPLTLYFNNHSSHRSIISGIITIITYLICIILTAYLSLDFIFKKNPNSYTYNRVIKDAGLFPFNESSMFHFVFISPKDIPEGYFEVIGIINNYVNIYNNDGNRSNFDHWVYKPCKNIKIKEQKIINLIDYEIYNLSLCISSFYNSTSNTFLSINDSNFNYPILAHGTSHPNKTFYGIFFQKCINSTLNKNNCKSEEEINHYISQHTSIGINLLNHEIEVLNYKSPFISSLYTLNSGFSDGFSANHLNFQPLVIKTHDKLFLSNKEYQEISYLFEQNEIQEWKSEVGIKGCIYFWMQNKAIVYERYYKRLENVLADAGGIIKIVITFGTWINHFFAKYVTYKDINLIIRKYIDINENIRATQLVKLKNKVDIFSTANRNLGISQFSHFSQFANKNKYISNNNDIIVNVIDNDNDDNNESICMKNIINKTNINKNSNKNINLNCSSLKLNHYSNNSFSVLKEKKKSTDKQSNFVVDSPSNINFRKTKNYNSFYEKTKFKFKDYLMYILNINKCSKKLRKRKQVNYVFIIEKYYKKIISEEEMFYLAYEVNSLRNYIDNEKNKRVKINKNRSAYSNKIIDVFSNIFKLN